MEINGLRGNRKGEMAQNNSRRGKIAQGSLGNGLEVVGGAGVVHDLGVGGNFLGGEDVEEGELERGVWSLGG